MDWKQFLWQGTIPTSGMEPAIITAGVVITIAFLWVVCKWAEIKPERHDEE